MNLENRNSKTLRTCPGTPLSKFQELGKLRVPRFQNKLRKRPLALVLMDWSKRHKSKRHWSHWHWSDRRRPNGRGRERHWSKRAMRRRCHILVEVSETQLHQGSDATATTARYQQERARPCESNCELLKSNTSVRDTRFCQQPSMP